MAYRAKSPILVGTDLNEGEARSFVLDKIERLRAIEDLPEEEEGEV